jgi:hypothetical protein
MVEHRDIQFSQREVYFLVISKSIEWGFWMTIEYAGAQRDCSCYRENLSSFRVAE